MENKKELRKQKKSERDALSAQERDRCNRKITRRLLGKAWYPVVRHILVYSAIHSEADLMDFCDAASGDGKKLYYPKVSGKEMEFFQVTHRDLLKPGAFSVPEPDTARTSFEIFRDQKDAVILVPGVAFSREGYRLGYGGGYYDRYLAKHSSLHKVGICFEMQLSEAWMTDEYDIPMDEILTECQCYNCKQEVATWKSI